MKEKKNKYIAIFSIAILVMMVFVLIYLNFFSSTAADDYDILTEKAEGEIIYLDTSIIELLNKLNNISYSRYEVIVEEVNENQQEGSTEDEGSSEEGSTDNSSSSDTESAVETTDESENSTSKLSQTNSLLNSNYDDIDWTTISYGVETLYSAWPTISIDMKSLNVAETDINNFSTTLDGAAQSIKLMDKNSTMINLYNLYVLLPKFLSYFNSDTKTINIYYTKAYVLNAYVSANSEKWEEMNDNLEAAKESLSIVINEEAENENSTLEKAYVLLDELIRGVTLEDKDIFYLKYSLTMEQLELL